MRLNECNLHIVTFKYKGYYMTFKDFNINLLLTIGCFVTSIFVTLMQLPIISKNSKTRFLEIIGNTFEMNF